jgi:hypothetical protein
MWGKVRVALDLEDFSPYLMAEFLPSNQRIIEVLTYIRCADHCMSDDSTGDKLDHHTRHRVRALPGTGP